MRVPGIHVLQSSHFLLCLFNAREATFETPQELIGLWQLEIPRWPSSFDLCLSQVELAGHGKLRWPSPSAPIKLGVNSSQPLIRLDF